MTTTEQTIEPGDIVRRIGVPGMLYRVWQIQGEWGHFYIVTKSGRRDRRFTGFSGGMTGFELVRKYEFPMHTACQKCGTKTVILIGGRCPKCNPFRACPVEGCLGDLESRAQPNWMNRWVCNKCGYAVSR